MEGSKTSEFKLTAVMMLVGAVLDGIGIVLESLKDSGVIHGSWLPVTLVIVGTGLMLFKALGYTRSRTVIKLAEKQSSLTEVLKVNTPFALEVARMVSEELAKRQNPPPTPPSPP
jgi:hypothetical protein